MDPLTRMITAWRFEEPDRVPVELTLCPGAKDLPGAAGIEAFLANEASGFHWAPSFEWGFMGLDSDYKEEVIEDEPGRFRRILRTHVTGAGEFTAVTRHLYDDLYGGGDPNDFHWEKRYFETLEDFKKVAAADRPPRAFNLEKYNRGCADAGCRWLPCTGIFHPLGSLVRNSNMQEVYMWMAGEEQVMLAYLEGCAEQICESLGAVKTEELACPPVFMTHALEMLIPPWLGEAHFKKFVFPFDSRINDAVHAIGGRHRAHCHGNCADFLELFAEMGIDGVEPLEPPPYGNNDLKKAKQLAGRRMLLAGNIPSQAFYLDSFRPADVRELVRRAVEEGAPGGGFFLRTTGGTVGNGKNREQRIKSINCGLEMIEAWYEYGAY